jgi:hypothetical protein
MKYYVLPDGTVTFKRKDCAEYDNDWDYQTALSNMS